MNLVTLMFKRTMDDRVLVGIRWLEHTHYAVYDRMDVQTASELSAVYAVDIPKKDVPFIAGDIIIKGEALRFYKTSMLAATGGTLYVVQ